jgi:hypothetical protein
MNIQMPDGTIISNVPDDVTPEQLELLKQQYSSPQPTTSLMKSVTGILPDIGGLSGAAAGAALGASVGSILPGAGTIAGGVIGGAIGAFSGAGAGESLRQLVEGEDASFVNAVGVASREGLLDITGAKALDVISGAGKYVLGKIGYSETNIAGKEALKELQQKLESRGTTLRGSQIDPNSSIISGIESAGEVAIGGKKSFDAIRAGQEAYLDSEIKAITRVSKKLEGQQLGKLIQNLIENTREASNTGFSQMFKKLEDDGMQLPVNLQGVRNMAATWKAEKSKGLTKRMQEAIKKGARIPFTASSVQSTVDDLLKLSPKSNFADSFEKLKSLKSKLTAMKGDPATRADPAVRELTILTKQFEEKLLESAKKADPEIGDIYSNLMKQYQDSQTLLYSDVANSILKQGSPELLGRYLTQTGEITPIQEVRKIIQQAKKLDVKEGGNIMLGIKRGFLSKSLSAASGQSFSKIETFKNQLADPDVSRTFNELFSSGEKERIFRLLDEAEILSRGVGGEFALSVRSSQYSGAVGAVKGQSMLSNAVKAITPAKIAEASADPKRAQEMLGLMKKVNESIAANKPIPQKALNGILLLLAETGREMVSQQGEAEREVQRQRLLQEINQ